jgi:hypothetical protein
VAQKEEPAREQWARTSDAHRTDFDRAKKPGAWRLGAWLLWIAGLALEVVGVLGASGDLRCPVLAAVPALTVIVALVLDAVCVLVAQRLWKRAQSVAGARGQSLVDVFMACLAFVPMLLFFATAKNAGTKVKGTALFGALVAVAGLLMARLFV